MITNIYTEADKRAVIGEEQFMFTQRFTETGLPGSNHDLNVDGSVTPVIFKISPPPGVMVTIQEVIVYIEDEGHFDTDTFGHDAQMQNGLIIHRRHAGVIVATIPIIIKTNADVASLIHDINDRHWAGDKEFMTARWTVGRGINGIVLDGNHQDNVEVQVRDDLTGLDKFYVTAQGVLNIRG